MMPMIADSYAPYYTAMVDGIATVYANNFTVDEMREIDAFYRRPGRAKVSGKVASDHAAEHAGRRVPWKGTVLERVQVPPGKGRSSR
jgi:uncharacterized protein DUF2059